MRRYTDIAEEEAVEILNKNNGYRTDIECPNCDGRLVVREGRSKFLGCSNYPKCKETLNLTTRIKEEKRNVIRFLDHNIAHVNSIAVQFHEYSLPEDRYDYPDRYESAFEANHGIYCKDDM